LLWISNESAQHGQTAAEIEFTQQALMFQFLPCVRIWPKYGELRSDGSKNA
jgi:hypothetical protein